jgi:hypothetical protein
MKLPGFYLLDAISKNVFDPYARHFAPFVIPLFLDTYRQVDQVTRSKMEEMLLTWRTGAPNGKELFGVITQLTIERGVWGGDTTSSVEVSRSFLLYSWYLIIATRSVGLRWIQSCFQGPSTQRIGVHIGTEGASPSSQPLGCDCAEACGSSATGK